jgi:pimeloyl-ACP methyl ester carboxylesterase
MTSRRSRARHLKSQPASVQATAGLGAVVTSHPYFAALAAGAAALAVSAFANNRLAAKAERQNPPLGKFIEVDGVRLHYVERGQGVPVVLLHGNGSMIQDFMSSGLIDTASERYRVIAFDRPGYGYSERPRSTIWTADAQAALIEAALAKLGISKAIVLGHSWGCSVTVALALRAPQLVTGLVLASGYYHPSVRADVVTMSGPAVPVLGDAIRFTISPILSRLMWPLMTKKIFGPARVPERFENGFPKEMTFRPSQIRASAAESALMIPDAFAARAHYADMKMPVVIVAGEDDRLIDIDDQSARLHAELPQSTFHRVPGAGHMVHQTAPEVMMAAIDEAVSAADRSPGKVVPLAA